MPVEFKSHLNIFSLIKSLCQLTIVTDIFLPIIHYKLPISNLHCVKFIFQFYFIVRKHTNKHTYTHRWQKYKSLWLYNKVTICEKFITQKSVPLAETDEKFIFYTQIVNDLEQQKPYYDIKSIRINLQPLIKSITNHAVEWRNTLGNILADKTRTNMMEIKDYIKVCCCGLLLFNY